MCILVGKRWDFKELLPATTWENYGKFLFPSQSTNQPNVAFESVPADQTPFNLHATVSNKAYKN